MWREWRAGARLLLCARRRKSAPLLELHRQHSRPQAAVSGRGQRSSAENRLLRAGVFVQLTGPLHHSGRRKSPFPVPASSGLRSHAQISMTLSKWGGQQERGGSRDPALRPLRPHPARKTHQCAQRHGFPDTFQVPTGASRPAGHTGLSQEVACREAGRKEESDLQSHTSFLHASLNVAGEGCALVPPPPVTTARAARPKPPGEPRSERPDHRAQ